jgi:hypothetical protein
MEWEWARRLVPGREEIWSPRDCFDSLDGGCMIRRYMENAWKETMSRSSFIKQRIQAQIFCAPLVSSDPNYEGCEGNPRPPTMAPNAQL